MEKFQNHILKVYGDQGKKWLIELPTTIQILEHDWNLRQLQPFSELSYNYVLKGYQRDIPIVLKISVNQKEIEQEAKALRAFYGYGAVSVIAQRDNALLLQCAVPGDQLRNSGPKKENIQIACKVIEKLQCAPLPKRAKLPHIEGWLANLDREWALPTHHLERARKLKKQLLQRVTTKKVLLHGDLHQGNILSHGSDWIVIDPKGVIGYPINEIWACVEDPSYDLPYLSNYFHYPLKDVVEWYYVHRILVSCWLAENDLDTTLFIKLAESILPILEG